MFQTRAVAAKSPSRAPRLSKSHWTNPLNQSRSWKSNSRSASQEVPRLLLSNKDIAVFIGIQHWTLTWNSISSHTHTIFSNMNFNIIFISKPRFHKSKPSPSKIHFNIILSPTPTSPRSVPPRFRDQNVIYISFFRHECYMPCRSHRHLFELSHNMKLRSSLLCNFLHIHINSSWRNNNCTLHQI
jgi:hypothetical protein